MPLIDLGEHGMLDIPDDAPPEALELARRQLQGKGLFLKAQEIPKPAGFLESAGRDLISGFGKTAAMVARGGAMLANTFGGVDEEGKQTPGTVMAPRTNGLARTLTDAADSAESYWNEVGKKSTLNPWGKGLMQGVGGAFAAGPIPVSGEAAAINAASGAGAGLGGVAADKLDPENKNPLLKTGLSTLAGAVAGTGTALATRARPQSANVAQELMGGLTEPQVMEAQAYMNELAKRGVHIDLAQALVANSGHSGDLSVVRDFVAGRNQGEALKRVLRSQPETLASETNMTIGSLPGRVWDTPEAANAVQQTASQVLEKAKQARSAEVRDLYAKAGDLPPETRSQLGAILNDFATRPGATDVLKQRAKEFANKLLGNTGDAASAAAAARQQLQTATSPAERVAAQRALQEANAAQAAATGSPVKALDADTWINELRGPWQGQPLKVAYPKEQGQIKGLAGALNQELQNLSPELRAAEQRFRQITQESINPLKQGPIGKLNQPAGYDPATQAMVSKFSGLMNEGSNPNAATSSIRTAARELSKEDPQVFASAFKTWLSDKIAKGEQASGAGSSLPTVTPEHVWEALFADGKRWQGMKDATAEMAAIQGAKPEDMVNGLANLRMMTKAMMDHPSGNLGGISPADLRQLGGTSATANLIRLGGYLPNAKAAAAVERSTFGHTLRMLDTILTSPDGGKMLIELGRVPPMSRKAQVILSTYGTQLGNTDGLSGNNPPE